jgi:hypothetical protein
MYELKILCWLIYRYLTSFLIRNEMWTYQTCHDRSYHYNFFSLSVKQQILQNSQKQNIGFQVPTAMTTCKDVMLCSLDLHSITSQKIVFFTYAKDYTYQSKCYDFIPHFTLTVFGTWSLKVLKLTRDVGTIKLLIYSLLT